MGTILLFQAACLHDNINRMVAALAAGLVRLGAAVELFDLRPPDSAARLVARLGRGDVDRVVSFAGFGLDPRPRGNLYHRPGLRLLSVYLDPLLLYWDQVALEIPGRVVTSPNPDDLDFCARHLPGRAVALLPHAADPLPPRDWAARDVEILFAGSLSDDPEGSCPRAWCNSAVAV